ncbi:MAG: alpha/beta hydrolase [Parasphingopyxis sp.]|uniref:alpha/beta fold hydrolase n=1 Tax=Parasphingopyxis sp. TaxID=1920299 RepID=UPI0032EBE64E
MTGRAMFNGARAAIAATILLPMPMACAAPGAEVPEPVAVEQTSAADRYIPIDGARVRVREEGPAGAPVIVLLHGFTMSLESWNGWAEALASDYRVVRYDLLGHGMTGPDPLSRYSAEERVEILRELLDRLHIDRATFGGNSFGGLVAWRFAARYPDRVDRLILVDSGAYSIYGVTDEPAPVPPAMRAYLTQLPEPAFQASLANIFADLSRISDSRKAEIREMMAQPGNAEAFIAHLEEFVLPDPEPDLARIEAPTLVLWGEEDALIPLEQAGWIEAAIPNARRITYPGVGHAPQEEIPAQTAADVRQFLRETSQ